jgi:hypothetical protein
MGKMVVDTTLLTEQNSDDPQAVIDFVVPALTDCVERGATEYFVVFSSHGGGWMGFGGDDNDGRRKLVQSNQSILNALTQALAAVPGAPSQLDVIGFDACYMQAMGAADEYQDIAKYILASEATEPGHGECGLKLRYCTMTTQEI